MDILQKEIDQLMDAGLITESKSDWSAPRLLIKKKDGGSFRFACDNRRHNKALTRVPAVTLPQIDQLLQFFHGHRYFCNLDMVADYNKITIHPTDVHNTTFATPVANYNGNTCPVA